MLYLLPFMFFNRFSVSKPRISEYFHALRASTDLKIGAAGYCWGGKFSTLLSHGERAIGGRPLIDAAFTAHPSMLDIPADIVEVNLPYSVAIGTNDMMIGPEALQKFKNSLRGKKDVELIVYEVAKHGFAVRGNPLNENEKKQGMQAEEQALRWFSKYL